MDSSSSSGSSMTMSSDSLQMSASMMKMVFYTADNTPLYSSKWQPNGSGSYAGTCIFLIILAAIFRGLVAGKYVLEQRWMDQQLNRRYVNVRGLPTEAERISMDSEAKNMVLKSERGVEEHVKVVRNHVRSVSPWRFSVDLPRAAYFTVLTAVGYLLFVHILIWWSKFFDWRYLECWRSWPWTLGTFFRSSGAHSWVKSLLVDMPNLVNIKGSRIAQCPCIGKALVAWRRAYYFVFSLWGKPMCSIIRSSWSMHSANLFGKCVSISNNSYIFYWFTPWYHAFRHKISDHNEVRLVDWVVELWVPGHPKPSLWPQRSQHTHDHVNYRGTVLGSAVR